MNAGRINPARVFFFRSLHNPSRNNQNKSFPKTVKGVAPLLRREERRDALT
jgi:hypothetical protein